MAASAQRDPTNAVNDTLASLENLIRLDTESTVGDLDLLVRVNKHAAERYKAMTDAAEGLETDSEHLKAKYAEVQKYVKQVDELDERVTDLEAIVRELEEWTGELEIKVRRIVPRRA
ncbi:biogenesis of lysosome-related organelles complex-1, subunit 2 [Pyronema domesticum]|uniref:Similar to Probable biogenesis of lysosome-related organelles complex 1 subunit 2 acc. no. Q54Y67 n=1 Tax=Pyronema omphalodes (strain CBS 100304) TaxID=1076935 RepID=U4LJH1_PYROM|nr:biogenesis of lysosome-related organelles complex-1, subunit 2 [Pyronema domesticum]CCX32098.1 Similar to Probable biogenesis of lysosome-related organelles complex 1 subunit 2; acc. no. Q54Y67 [Pyronema omphalodes CBS 100304]